MPLIPQPPFDDRSLAAAIARALETRIISGALGPGVRLRQDAVAAEFRASHVPVREAFRRLEAIGLAVAEPRRGVRVAPLTPADVLEVAAMRATLEPLALRHALPRLTKADFTAIRTAIEEGARGTEIADLEEANRRFHAALLTPCAMPRLLAAIAGLHRMGARHLHATWRGLNWKPRSDAEHGAILAAVEAADAEEACYLLSAHVAAAGEALAAALSTDPTDP
jgi:DNA-binding GntR family transcriptional regulator